MMVEEITQVPQSALPLARLRAHLRLGTGFGDEALQDDLLAGFLRAALAAVEARTGKALMTRRFLWRLSSVPRGGTVSFPMEPVRAIASAELRNGKDAPTDMSEVLEVTPESRLQVRGAGLPYLSDARDLRIEFEAGYAERFNAVPDDLQQAVLMLAAHYYEHRSDTGLGAGCMPFGVTALIERHRRLRIGFGAGQ